MLKYNDKEIRNLVEQVQKNKEDIANHYAIDRALSNFGIKIVGTISSTLDLPDPLTYTGDYGDGYAVGQPGAYDYYIYTRPDLNAGQPDNYWLNAGPISVVGPQGPQGEQGPQGIPGESNKWYTGSYPANPNIGDMFLSANGQVFQYMNDSTWSRVATIVGPQGVQGIQGIQGETGPIGPQGPKGDTGDVGGFINIYGILDNTNQLPTPASLNNLTVAYLVGANKDLYIQVGETSDTAIWNNVGPFNAATLVTSGGVAQNVWDADTKVGFTDYATFNTPGVVKIKELGSILLEEDGQITVKSYGGGTKISTINGAKQYNNGQWLISAPIINLAVKSGLAYSDIGYDFSDGSTSKGNWTEDEKASARTTLGAIGATDYATSSSGGVVKVGSGSQGIGINPDGVLYINPANDFLLGQQVNSYTPVVPQNIALAVKKGLIDPNKSATYPANWTVAEKSAARTTLEAGKKYYRHIVTTSNGGSGYIISTLGEAYQGIITTDESNGIIKMCVTDPVTSAGIITEQFVINGTLSAIKQLETGGYSIIAPINITADAFSEM